jgi:hypothetical protein
MIWISEINNGLILIDLNIHMKNIFVEKIILLYRRYQFYQKVRQQYNCLNICIMGIRV